MRGTMIALVGLVLCAGCSNKGDGKGGGNSPDTATGKQHMREVVIAIHDYEAAKNKAPVKAEDLLPHIRDEKAKARLTAGDIVVQYGVRITEMPDGASNTILAYEKEVPEKGGVVGMGDGSVEVLKADEFKSKPLAKKK